MGMYVSFIRMTTEQLEHAETDPEWAEEFVDGLYASDAEPLPEGTDADIQKSWAALDHLFEAAGLSFEIQMGGYNIVMEDGWYYNGWSPEDVQGAAKVLTETSFDALAEHCGPESLSAAEVYPMRHLWDAEDFESLREDYETLRDFFVATAKTGHGALMSFG